ncbi:hypothetical protein [Pseudomonas sp. KNUC1026]|uniref:hypothetical protein n=1 Tax=Pseudomonas sp. KNUC1026 TaxID=2893890 RepID=UPI001F16EF94|nr:hypothetical protein [Pseudomonas sp. KNUC1026]UFH48874.1 hypothetical protein LN139_18145 [Pseudomonas sp. KNUC1026]
MSKEDRIYFEKELTKHLRGIEYPGLTIRVVKAGVKFLWNKTVVAELDFQFVLRANSYTLQGRVFGGPIFECSQKHIPPYRSNIYNEGCFSFTTSGRQDKKFSDNVCGDIGAPKLDEVASMCQRIRRSLEGYYVPLIAGCIIPNHSTVQNVLESPTDYAYPAVFIHSAITCNPACIDKQMLDRLLSNNKIIKNKAFDLALFNNLQALYGCCTGPQDS